MGISAPSFGRLNGTHQTFSAERRHKLRTHRRLTSEPDGGPGPAELAGAGQFVGCRVVGVDGREVRDKAALFAALGRVRGHAEFAIDTAADPGVARAHTELQARELSFGAS